MRLRKKDAVVLNATNSYIGKVTCMNCTRRESFKVPKGMPLVEFACKVKCDGCLLSDWKVGTF